MHSDTGQVVLAGPEWFHELKMDGYRLRLERDSKRVRLITKGGYDFFIAMKDGA